MSKITIFLDYDGVLCTVKQFNLTPKSKSWLHGTYFGGQGIYPFDKKCVKVLNEILSKIDCDVVVSSDWRLYNTIEQLQEIFEDNGVIGKIVGVTPNYPISMTCLEKNRAHEILKYVKDKKIDNWLAIDDLYLYNHFGDEKFSEKHFILCKTDFEGIKESGLKEKIITKLNKFLK